MPLLPQASRRVTWTPRFSLLYGTGAPERIRIFRLCADQPPALADDAAGFAPQRQAIDFVRREPARVRGVGGGLRITPERPRAIVDKYIMFVSRTDRVVVDELHDIDETEDIDRKAGFFPHFAEECRAQRFAGFDLAAGQAPFVLTRRIEPPDQQHLVLPVPDDRAHAQNERRCSLVLSHGDPPGTGRASRD